MIIKLKQIFILAAIIFNYTVTWSQTPNNLIIISIDGFRSNFYMEEQWPTPHIKDLASNGVYSKGVNGIFPTVTYPSHTTLITGVGPDKHGIYYNTEIAENGESGKWIYDFSQIKSQTLWQVAKEKGLKTASVSWPISVNAPYIDYNIPEIWSFTNPMDRRGATDKYATPSGLFQEVVENATGKMNVNDYNLSSLSMDQNLARIAAYILRKYKPNVLTIHLPNTDGAQHKNGRLGIEVQKAIAGADQAVGTIIDALKKADLFKKTNIIITGDHGFMTVHTSIAPNLWLKEMNVHNKAFFFSTGGSAFLHLKDANDKKTLNKILNKLHSLPYGLQKMFKIINREQMTLRGADPRAVLALSATNGYCFTNEKTGELLNKKIGGKHGQYPDNELIQTGFVAFGPNFQKGLLFNQLQLEDIAPLAAHLLGTLLNDSKGIIYNSMLVK
ncbi:alkaline phosphatase family protein [Ochrovirga pacifica]|uniref:alkaline phosphatase family protein n=1 Tax=Ochrovirga pacifica TaxID=1042376 RepID=UPI0002559FFC|nr:ectonucleotide pyrophosphatase/phosphodiesterase [Ochrovirga pacifica]